MPEKSGMREAPAERISSRALLGNIRGIIFDFDGTLFDNARLPFHLIAAFPPDVFRIWRERRARKSFEGRDFASPDAYYDAFFAALGKACLRSPERIRDWYFRRYMPRMCRVLEKHYRPMPGVKEFLEGLGESAAVSQDGTARKLPADFPAVAVYSDYPCLRERLRALDVNPGRGVRLYSPESFGAQKPAPRPFREIAGDMGAQPEEVLVIGDREDTDGLGAYNAGMRFFHLITGRRKKRRSQQPAVSMYSGTWSELSDLFRKYYLDGE